MRKAIVILSMGLLVGMALAQDKKDQTKKTTVRSGDKSATVSTVSSAAQKRVKGVKKTSKKKNRKVMKSGKSNMQGKMMFIDENGDGINDLMQDDDGDGIPNYKDPDWKCPGCSQKENRMEREQQHRQHAHMNGPCPHEGGSKQMQERHNQHEQHRDQHQRHENNHRHHDNNKGNRGNGNGNNHSGGSH